MTAEKNRDKTSKFDSKYTYMHKLYALLLSICVSFFVQLQAQGTCNPAANIIIYANYDGGNLTIDIDENVPDIRIGICTYERSRVNITGTYADNVTQVLCAGYDNDGTTSVTGVDAGLVDILLYPPVTELDPDGYPYMICAYECDTNYVPGGCNTVEDYFSFYIENTYCNLIDFRLFVVQENMSASRYLIVEEFNSYFFSELNRLKLEAQDIGNTAYEDYIFKGPITPTVLKDEYK